MKRLKRIAPVAGMLVLGLLLAGIAMVARGIELPEPTGPHAIGRTVFRWTDHSRPEVITESADDYRELVVYLWYPAAPGSGGATAAYFPDADVLKAVFAPLELFGVTSARTHAAADAPLSTSAPKYPVIIFSHGNRANSAFHTAQIEDLVSHGYIVAGIDHPYDALGVVLSSGKRAAFAEDKWSNLAAAPGTSRRAGDQDIYRDRVEVRARDAVFALDRLAELNADGGGRFAGRLDMEQVGIAGHSVGGVAAGRACQLDRRFKACLNLDGLAEGQPFYPDEEGRGPVQPYMLMLKPLPVPSVQQLTEWKVTREAWQARQREHLDGLLTRVDSGSYKVTFTGFTHQSFSDNPLMYPSLPESLATLSLRADAAAHRQVQLTREYTLTFFEKHVKGEEQALLDQLSSRDPEVSIETFGVQEVR